MLYVERLENLNFKIAAVLLLLQSKLKFIIQNLIRSRAETVGGEYVDILTTINFVVVERDEDKNKQESVAVGWKLSRASIVSVVPKFLELFSPLTV